MSNKIAPKNKPFAWKRFAEDVLSKRTKDEETYRSLSKKIGLSAASVHRAECAGITGFLKIEQVIELCNWLNVPMQKYLS